MDKMHKVILITTLIACNTVSTNSAIIKDKLTKIFISSNSTLQCNLSWILVGSVFLTLKDDISLFYYSVCLSQLTNTNLVVV